MRQDYFRLLIERSIKLQHTVSIARYETQGAFTLRAVLYSTARCVNAASGLEKYRDFVMTPRPPPMKI